jgi:two-component system, OmpR family, copper resistance phosphate regulon response regulator CusR
MTVLVVEDEPRIASFIDSGLRAQGLPSEAVASGAAALGRLRQGNVLLVILDLGLPDLDGLDVLRSLRGAGSTVPVIIVSSRRTARDRALGFELGADDYITKPFVFGDLLARVRSRLGDDPNGRTDTAAAER